MRSIIGNIIYFCLSNLSNNWGILHMKRTGQSLNIQERSPISRFTCDPNLLEYKESDNMTTNTQPPKNQMQIVGEFKNSSMVMNKKNRRLSFIQLETDKQIIMEKMIRDQMKMQGKISRKMSLQQDQTCLCSSDIYTKDDVHWKNREISQLTTKKFDSIPIDKIRKIKLLNQHPMAGYNLFRVTTGDKQTKDYAIRTIDASMWFGKAIWICLIHAGNQMGMKRDYQGEIEGNILKKSQFLGNWQLRYVAISSKNGLISSPKKGAPGTVKIKETSQLWSRLEIITYEGLNYVIIKTWHMMFKYQFAVPIQDCVKWAKAFSTLVK